MGPLLHLLLVGLLATVYTPPPPAPGVAVESDPIALPAAETAQDDIDAHLVASPAHALAAISGAGTMAAAATGDYLSKVGNLAGLADVAAARTSLGLGTAAVEATATFLQTANNLSDVTAATARTNLGLTSAATCTLGTAASNCVQLNGSGQLPAVSAALLTDLPASSALVQRNWTGGSAITTASVAPAATATGDVAGWFDLGLIHRVRVTAATSTSATIEFFAEGARTTLLYQVTAVNLASPFEDLVPTHYRDDGAGAQFHYKITNVGASASTFTLSIVGIGE